MAARTLAPTPTCARLGLAPARARLASRRATTKPLAPRRSLAVVPSLTSRGLAVCQASPEPSAAPTTADASRMWEGLSDKLEYYKSAPPSEKDATPVREAMEGLKAAGALPKWGAIEGQPVLNRRNIFPNELRMVGIKDPASIGRPTTRNDLAFLATVVGTTSVLALALGQLPGEWGFWGMYLSGGISIAVLAVGSTAPGLLQFAIDKFSLVFPDYRDRVLRHEAAHFLVGYLAGVPVTGYSLLIGKEHVDFMEAKLQRKVFQGRMEDEDLNSLAVVSMSGVAAEAMEFEEVVGQTADLMDLQRMMNRAANKLSDQQQQSLTRWAVHSAASLLRTYDKEYEALMDAMRQGRPVDECIEAIEGK